MDDITESWWSKEWLSGVLKGISKDEILDGQKLFNTARFKSFEIFDNKIIAEIEGRRGSIKKVYIHFEKIAPDTAQDFFIAIRRTPNVFLALKNKRLHPYLKSLCELLGVYFFEGANHFKCGCTCSNRIPCKYIVATLYKIATEISKNPFLLFTIYALKAESYFAENNEIYEVPKEAQIIFPKKSVKKYNNFLDDFDFDSWKNYSEILLSILPHSPKFCPTGNFKKSYADEFLACQNFFLKYQTFEEFTEDFRVYNTKIFIAEKECIEIIHHSGFHFEFILKNDEKTIAQKITTAQIIGALCSLSSGNLSWHSYNVRYLYKLLQVAFYIIRTGVVIPQVFWLDNSIAQVRWLPTEMLSDVQKIVFELEMAIPSDMLFTNFNAQKKQVQEPAKIILSLFIGQLFRFARKFKPAQKHPHENLLSFFFDSKSGKLAHNANSIPQLITQWFSVYYDLDFRTDFTIQLREEKNLIVLEIFVFEKGDRVPLKDLFEEKQPKLLSILSILKTLGETFKPLDNYLNNRALEPEVLSESYLLQFLHHEITKLKLMGIQYEIPKNLALRQKPKVQMKIQGEFSLSHIQVQDLLDFNWEVALGDHQISAKEFLELTENAEGLLKYKGEFYEFSQDDLQNIADRINNKKQQKISKEKLIQSCLTGAYENSNVVLTDSLKNQIAAWKAETVISLPENLNATLRPYQERGFSWMYKNLKLGFGSILADDMGLGKTLQVIAYLLKLKNEERLTQGKALIIVPTGLLCNWQVEIKKFAPTLTFFAYHGGKRSLTNFKEDLLLTTYTICRKDFKKLEELNWEIIVIDEAQNIKNANTDQSRIVRALKAPQKIAMSGTPVENRLMEFWSIMDFCNPGLFPSAEKFRAEYEIPIQKNANEHTANAFKKITAPFMLRRLKTDKNIISDLPEKIIQDEYAELTKTQAALYKTTLNKFLNEINALDEEQTQLFKRQGIILQMILALKQICNHPITFLKNQEIPLAKGPENSGKLTMLLDLLSSIEEQNEKALIFTQFTSMGEILKAEIEEHLNIKTGFYHGGLSQKNRENLVQEFQEKDEIKVLILSLKAGGTGLNLTAASHVIHFDLWWNPAIEAQASDRAFRIGQKKNVQVHRFITKGTFEEKINELLSSKKALSELTVHTGETWITQMNDDELGEIFRLR